MRLDDGYDMRRIGRRQAPLQVDEMPARILGKTLLQARYRVRAPRLGPRCASRRCPTRGLAAIRIDRCTQCQHVTAAIRYQAAMGRHLDPRQVPVLAFGLQKVLSRIC